MNSKLGHISFVFGLSSFLSFTACSNYQEDFDNNFGALQYADDMVESSPSSGDDLSSPSGDDILSSSLGVEDPLSSFEPASSDGKRSSSSSVIAASSSSDKATSSSSSRVNQSSSSETSSSSFDYSSSGKFTDPRSDDNSISRDYRYVRYNGLVWMDEDLSYRTNQMVMDDNQPLYSWKSAQKACPEGWRLPTIEEFNNSQGLEEEMGIRSELIGYFLMTGVHKAGNEGMYWTQSSKDDTVYAIQFSNNRYEGAVIGVDKKVLEENSASAVFAVRCVTESLITESPRSSSSSVFISRETYLQDSIPYATVTIGGVKWMAQNLNYYGGTLQSSGHSMLCRDKTSKLDSCDSNGVYYDYWSAFDIASMDEGKNVGGRLIAWTLPNSTEATALLEAVGDAGRLWSVEMNGTNESGFYALPSGYFSTSDGSSYEHKGGKETCFWLWSGNDGTETANALCFYPDGNAGHLYGIEQRLKTQLFPIRLIYSSLHD